MNKKIIDFDIIIGGSIFEFHKSIVKALQKGWPPVFPIIEFDRRLLLPMVKYEDS